MENWLINYFTDPVLRAPTIGCMLMCLAASLVGVIAFLKKQSLIGEALSHASFPGVILGVVAAGVFSEEGASLIWLPLTTMAGALATALLGLFCIHYLEIKKGIRSDSALCFILSLFFGIGVTLASRVQFTHSTSYTQSMNYLYGQAATMMDVHILIYAILSIAVILIIAFFYKELQVLIFDQEYAKSIGVKTSFIRVLIFLLIAFAIVIGIRSVGVILMSAMLIAPASAARQYTHRLSKMMLLSGFFGILSGFLGVFFSVELTRYFNKAFPSEKIVFPTGPMIVIAATAICLISLLVAPERGLFIRLLRRLSFKYHCCSENVLKTMWLIGPHLPLSLKDISHRQNLPSPWLFYILMRLKRNGWVQSGKKGLYKLSIDGTKRAQRVVRLHRLWELYLSDHLGIGAERVHRSAEEMEHIITPEIESELTVLLKEPTYDPHNRPIPPLRG